MENICPDCDEEFDTPSDEMEHRVKNHTEAGGEGGFNLYHDEVFPIFNDIAVRKAVAECDNPTVRDVIDYLNDELGVPARMPDDDGAEVMKQKINHYNNDEFGEEYGAT